MALNYTKNQDGINLVPQNNNAPSSLGDIRYNSTTNQLEYFNGALTPIVAGDTPTVDGVQFTGATSGTLTLTAAPVTTSYGIQFPSADGTNGQVLSTNGDGTTQWRTVSGVASANDTLSNLSSPTAINQNLTFSGSLSSPVITTPNAAAGSNGLFIKTGNATNAGASGGDISIIPGTNSSGHNGNLNLTLSTLDSSSGKVNITTSQFNLTANNGIIINGSTTFQNGSSQTQVQILGGPSPGQGGKLVLGGTTGAGTQIIAADSGFAGTFVWPSTGGTIGQVLTGNAGTLSFQNVSTLVDGTTLDQTGSVLEVKNGGITKAKLAALGLQTSTSSGLFSTASTSFTAVTNLTITITTTGRPVMITLMPDGDTSTGSYIRYDFGSGTNPGAMKFFRDASAINQYEVGMQTASVTTFLSPSSYNYIDTPTAGTYTYTVQVRATAAGSGTFDVVNTVLMAYEL